MVSPQEHQEAYQAALAWVTRQVEEAQRQGLTLDDLGGLAYVSATSEGLGASVARVVWHTSLHDVASHASLMAVGAGALEVAAASS